MESDIILVILIIATIEVILTKRSSKKSNAIIDSKLNLILSQMRIDHTSIEIPEKVHATVLSYLDYNQDPLLVNKAIIRRNAVDNAISHLVQEMNLPRQIAEQIITDKFNIDMDAEL